MWFTDVIFDRQHYCSNCGQMQELITCVDGTFIISLGNGATATLKVFIIIINHYYPLLNVY